jgi:RNA ligase (TIGR02306 family)
MATFEAKVYRLRIEEHPNADALELAVVGDYRSIVRKGQFRTGDLGVYIPEAAIIPHWLIQELGLEGKLAGKNKNRVKAVKLRGILSQGVILPVVEYPFHTDPEHYGRDMRGENVGVSIPDGTNSRIVKFAPEGTDVTEFLGITKYEPPIPVHMAGEVFNAHGYTMKYDIENFKRYPDILVEGEEVVMTEKIHGTWCCFGYHPEIEHPIVTSKGLSEKGLAFKFNAANENNLYLRALRNTERNGDDAVTHVRRLGLLGDNLTPFYILGEIYGKGVQDLDYGAEKPSFRVFDIYVGEPGQGRYISASELQAYCTALHLRMVPIIYSGPFSKEKMEEVTSGVEVVSGNNANLREGVVIKPETERHDDELGRVILKSVSEAYLLRKGGTEFN